MTEIATYPLRVELPKGQHAMLRDPEDVPERLRRPHLDAREHATATLMGTGMTEADAEAARDGDRDVAARIGMAMISSGSSSLKREADDLLIVALVQSWSYEDAVSAEALQDIPGRAYDVLLKACEPLAAVMSPDFSPNPDPDSPTSPSSV